MFSFFWCFGCMHRKPTSDLLPFDLEFEKTMRKLKKLKVEQVIIEDVHNDRYGENNSDHNDLLGII